MSYGAYEPQNFFQLTRWCVVMVVGSLVEHQLLPLSKDSFSLLSIYIISRQVFQILNFPVRDPLNHSLNIGSSCWLATQSVTCRFTCAWVALARITVSLTCLCISSSALATTRSCASALSVVPMVTPSRMNVMVPASSFDVTWLRASAAAFYSPFWYSMLKVNLTSDSAQWCWVASKLDVVMA